MDKHPACKGMYWFAGKLEEFKSVAETPRITSLGVLLARVDEDLEVKLYPDRHALGRVAIEDLKGIWFGPLAEPAWTTEQPKTCGLYWKKPTCSGSAFLVQVSASPHTVSGLSASLAELDFGIDMSRWPDGEWAGPMVPPQ